jgi:single-stranded-DNA-specific exonuclease
VEIPLSLLTEENMVWLQRFEPFGPLNELPLFYSEDVEILGPPRIVGEKHLKLSLAGPMRPGNAMPTAIDAIGFNLGYLKAYLGERTRAARIAYHPEWNTFRGQRRIQLRLVAIE